MIYGRILDFDRRTGENLSAALLTTFDPPDYKLLADRVLPALVGLPPAPAKEAAEFARARCELCKILETLRRGRLIVVSSSRPNDEISWLSSYVRFMRTATVQHAKLWMLLWKLKQTERLEIIVSSANLTSSGFDHQLQSAWRTSLTLGEKKESNLKSWSDLPIFLNELASSCLSDGEIELFASLLSRVRCPKGTKFVATTPSGGTGTASLKRALSSNKPSQIRVFAPYVGDWTQIKLDGWLKEAGCTAAKVTCYSACKIDPLMWGIGVQN